MRNGIRNDDLRLGIRWRLNNSKRLKPFFDKIKMRLSMNPMFIQWREATELKYNSIIEYVYNIMIFPKTLHNRVYIGGFIDQNFIYYNSKITMEFVTEHQIGLQLFRNLFAVCEYRVSTFLLDEPNGIGYGIEYKSKF